VDIQVLITDRAGKVVADPVEWIEVDCEPKFNEPGPGMFRAAATDALLEVITPGYRVLLIRDGAHFHSGPIEKPGKHSWQADRDGSGPGELTVHWTDDLALICGRITYPVHTAAFTAQTVSARYIDTDFAGTLMTELVDRNAGPGALTAREVASLVIGDGAGLGASVKVSTRFEPLGDVLRTLAILGGGLGFRTFQNSTPAIEFEVYDPVDRPNVRFSRGLGNLRSFDYDPEAPTVTAAQVGGGGEGTARTNRERLNAGAISSWWRLEQFLDQRHTTDNAELDAAGDEALATGAEKAKLVAVTVEHPDYRFGDAFVLGDQVYISPRDGADIHDIVRAVRLTATPDEGELLAVLIGTEEASTDPAWVRDTRQITRRVGRLEAI
jgi:hypothetical protein